MTDAANQRRREAQAEAGTALLRDAEQKFETWRHDPAAGAAQARELREETARQSRRIVNLPERN